MASSLQGKPPDKCVFRSAVTCKDFRDVDCKIAAGRTPFPGLAQLSQLTETEIPGTAFQKMQILFEPKRVRGR